MSCARLAVVIVLCQLFMHQLIGVFPWLEGSAVDAEAQQCAQVVATSHTRNWTADESFRMRG